MEELVESLGGNLIETEEEDVGDGGNMMLSLGWLQCWGGVGDHLQTQETKD